jgi:ferric-dicitrate binding protein FerR (iron transport regulator)
MEEKIQPGAKSMAAAAKSTASAVQKIRERAALENDPNEARMLLESAEKIERANAQIQETFASLQQARENALREINLHARPVSRLRWFFNIVLLAGLVFMLFILFQP